MGKLAEIATLRYWWINIITVKAPLTVHNGLLEEQVSNNAASESHHQMWKLQHWGVRALFHTKRKRKFDNRVQYTYTYVSIYIYIYVTTITCTYKSAIDKIRKTLFDVRTSFVYTELINLR